METDRRPANGAAAANDASTVQGSVLAEAAALRTVLRFHALMGISEYPLTPALKQGGGGFEAIGPVVIPSAVVQPGQAPVSFPTARGQQKKGTVADQWRVLRESIEACRLCGLAADRQGMVCGSGPLQASLLVVGDYSAQETGFSTAALFGGDEETMLWNMMRAIGLSAADVYVTNLVKCCPSPNSVPTEESTRCCRVHLLREIDLVRPRVILAMGEAAARALIGRQESVVRLRGRFHPLGPGGGQGSPVQVMVTFHPRYLARHPDMKKAAWQDLQMIQRAVRGS